MSAVVPPSRVFLRDLPTPPGSRTGWPWTEEAPPLADRRPDGTPWPTFTIVTPVDDGEGDLEATLRSVLLQGYPRLEYLVVGNGELHGSGEILSRSGQRLAHDDVEQATPRYGEAMNRGFERTRGDALTYLTP